MEKKAKQTKTLFLKVFAIGIAGAAFLKVLDYYGSSDSPPEYPEYQAENMDITIDIGEVYENDYEKLSDETKRLLFLQTGLGEEGIEAVIGECHDEEELLDSLKRYQAQLYGMGDIREIVPLKEGDVLVSLSQRLFFYPHGHAAIVIDGENQKILEAKSYKVGSCISDTDKWYTISSFVVLRLREDVVEEFMKEKHINPSECAANYAVANLNGLPYSLFKDLRPLSDTVPEYTQCAHLVWYAYYACGLDIDENRGLIIKPKDFLKSEVFEVVQVFGISPEEIMDMREEFTSYE